MSANMTVTNLRSRPARTKRAVFSEQRGKLLSERGGRKLDGGIAEQGRWASSAAMAASKEADWVIGRGGHHGLEGNNSASLEE